MYAHAFNIDNVTTGNYVYYYNAGITPNVHYWGGTNESTWPGPIMTQIGSTGLYYTNIGNNTSIKFNENGNGDLTGDINGISNGYINNASGLRLGTAMTYVGQNTDNQGVYKITITGQYNKILFYDGSGAYSFVADIDQSTNNAYWLSSANNSAYTIGGRWNCVELTFRVNDPQSGDGYVYIEGITGQWVSDSNTQMAYSSGYWEKTFCLPQNTATKGFKFYTNKGDSYWEWSSETNRSITTPSQATGTITCVWGDGATYYKSWE